MIPPHDEKKHEEMLDKTIHMVSGIAIKGLLVKILTEMDGNRGDPAIWDKMFKDMVVRVGTKLADAFQDELKKAKELMEAVVSKTESDIISKIKAL